MVLKELWLELFEKQCLIYYGDVQRRVIFILQCFKPVACLICHVSGKTSQYTYHVIIV